MNHGIKEEKKPALVLDDSCLLQQDFSLSLMGKVKELGSLSNLKVVLATEASNSFYSDGRVAWVDIEGDPLKVWTKNTFARIISKWGELVFEEGKEESCRNSKRVGIKTTLKENIFESFKIIVQGKVYWVRAKEVSCWNANFMGVDDNIKSGDDSMDEENGEENDGKRSCYEEELNSVAKKNSSPTTSKEDGTMSACGILCVWDPRLFRKQNSTISDYFVAIKGEWVLNAKIVIMGDFNEVRSQDERFGSTFNVQGAANFNSFTSLAGLVEVPLGGCLFTWVYKSTAKMSKLDHFLILEGLMELCSNISASTLDRYLSDHRPILLREICFDYGPNP
ncbi:RNA-directed DNA polymerase, eukaryota [Tanacetum coccineum]